MYCLSVIWEHTIRLTFCRGGAESYDGHRSISEGIALLVGKVKGSESPEIWIMDGRKGVILPVQVVGIVIPSIPWFLVCIGWSLCRENS